VATYDAGTGAFAFSDDFTKTNYFQILNFGNDDTIAYPGSITESMLSVANTGTDVQLLVNNASTVSSIILKNVCDAAAFITTVQEFNALPVGNIISVGATQFVTDTTPPAVVVTSNKASLSVGETAIITFTLSEPSTNFVLGDAVATGGSLSAFTGSGTSYSAVFTPTANSTTLGKVSVASGVFTDAAGNANADGSEANNTAQMTVNTVAQQVTRTAVALDALTPAGTQTAVATYDAGTGAFAFSDDFTKTNYFQIFNFGSDDTITYPGSITESLLSVANNGPDVQLLVNNASTVSSIILKNVCDKDAFITTVADWKYHRGGCNPICHRYHAADRRRDE
jgi:hypothetical protein